MANTVLVKMTCLDIKTGNQGNTEDVYLKQVPTNDATVDNTQTANQREVQPKAELNLSIRAAVGKKQFKKGQNYSVAFTEVT
jgi:hypothetical protein